MVVVELIKQLYVEAARRYYIKRGLKFHFALCLAEYAPLFIEVWYITYDIFEDRYFLFLFPSL